MEDGGVDTTVIELAAQDWPNGQLSSPFSFLASSVFDSLKHDVPQIESQTMRFGLMNSFNTTLFLKFVDP